MRHRDRERERERESDIERETATERQQKRDSERETARERQRESDSEWKSVCEYVYTYQYDIHEYTQLLTQIPESTGDRDSNICHYPVRQNTHTATHCNTLQHTAHRNP